MKKSMRSLAVLGVCALSLTACGEATFADFQSKAKEALQKDVQYKTATVSGTAKSSDDSNKSESKIAANLTLNNSHILVPASLTNASDVTYAAVLNAFSLATFSATEVSTYKYYAGSNFKVTYEYKDEDNNSTSNASISWNDVGLVTAIKAKGTGSSSKTTYNLTVKYSK